MKEKYGVMSRGIKILGYGRIAESPPARTKRRHKKTPTDAILIRRRPKFGICAHSRAIYCHGSFLSYLSLTLFALTATAHAQTVIQIDAAAKRHPISPLIYGVCFGSKAQMAALNFTLNRQGGNNFTRYNWRTNTVNIDNDYYFESIPGFFLNQPTSLVPGQRADSFVADTKAAGAQPMLSIPMLGWVAKVSSPSRTLYSFSVAKYGPQEKTDPNNTDIGNGMKPDGKTPIVGNDPNDASVPADVAFQHGWVTHLIGKWGTASQGGVRYYIMDNEPGLWHGTHRDVFPVGVRSDDYLQKFVTYASMVRKSDRNAQIVGPEEWGWPGFTESGFDQQYAGAHHYQGHPDKDAHSGQDFMPWLLTQLHHHDVKAKTRLLDVFSFHIYPQGGDYTDDVTPKIQSLRNRSTRALWDPTYKDESWINNTIMLIPRLQTLVKTYYPGTKTGITEYNWGAEKNIGGATAEADILGIFGREGLDLATRWTCPEMESPTFKAMQMYRNYDGHKSTFGNISISDQTPDPDTLSSFAALRSSGKALTVLVVNKALTGSIPITLALSHFADSGTAEVWQLTSANIITRLPNAAVTNNKLSATLPAQSITLFVLARR